jgi:hypothetical protein
MRKVVGSKLNSYWIIAKSDTLTGCDLVHKVSWMNLYKKRAHKVPSINAEQSYFV